MPYSAVSVFQTRLAKKKRRKRAVIGLLVLAVVSCAVLMAVLVPLKEQNTLPPVVLRVDDIQDYAFREGQRFLLEESAGNGVPLSLAVIACRFGEDNEIVSAVRSAVASGSEVTAHGWIHEDLTAVSLQEQVSLLSRAKTGLRELFGCDSAVLVPPMFKFNEDTLSAMRETGFNVISSSTQLAEPGFFSGVLSIPGTVNLSDYSQNSTWNMKTIDAVKEEVSASVSKYGFAVIVTHPQEFLDGVELDPACAELYRSLLKALKTDYSFTTLEALHGRVVK